MSEKICFVMMGFGKKTDFLTGNTFDLDKTYQYIIQPAIVQSGYQCIRADEIQEGGLIDKSMYAMLIQADLIIADISTYNPNAIYELGIRHAVRPFSTIIIKEKGIGKIPFDLDHSRMFTYSYLGEDAETEEVKRSIKGLSGLINKISNKQLVDNSLYEFINNANYPSLPEEEYQRIVSDLKEKEEYIFAQIDKSSQRMEEGDFDNACRSWEKAKQAVPNETYFIQQQALSKYKSKAPSTGIALTDALMMIEELHPTNDPETLGVTGAIYKNMYQNSGDIQYLNRAIEYYGKAFKTSHTYYAGENYALCLNIKAHFEKNVNEKIYYKIEANKTREKIIKLLEEFIQFEDFEQRIDKKWMFATLAHCYFSIKEKAVYFEKKFFALAVKWEKETYLRSKEEIEKYRNDLAIN
jgi:hypothetical protein